MPKCKIKECDRPTQYKVTKNPYCVMHLARIRRHGYPELKTGSHGLEKLPHDVVDDFILVNYKSMLDKEIAAKLKDMGYSGVDVWTVRYRRRKLGNKKYLYGEIQKHKAWVRAQAIKRYGVACELCGYKLVIDTHHIIPKHKGGLHDIKNLMIICPNCHAIVTRKIIALKKRYDIPRVRKIILGKIKSFYQDI